MEYKPEEVSMTYPSCEEINAVISEATGKKTNYCQDPHAAVMLMIEQRVRMNPWLGGDVQMFQITDLNYTCEILCEESQVVEAAMRLVAHTMRKAAE